MLCNAKDIYYKLQLELRNKNKILEQKDKEIELKDLENNDLIEHNRLIIKKIKPHYNKHLLLIIILLMLILIILIFHVMK
jgi:hypothetical protein